MRLFAMRGICLLALAGLLGSCGGSTAPANSSSASTPPSEASAAAASERGMIADPPGDALMPSAPGYVDALSAGVFEAGDKFSFAATLAAQIPPRLELPTGWDALLWSFCLDTDDPSAPSGYPFAASTTVPCEFIVAALSKGKGVAGTLIDRRPLLDAKEAATTPIPVVLDGTTITMVLPAARLGDPTRFTWVMATSALTLPLPNDEFLDVDEVPDSSFNQPAQWPGGS
jgi:hypothetical protein